MRGCPHFIFSLLYFLFYSKVILIFFTTNRITNFTRDAQRGSSLWSEDYVQNLDSAVCRSPLLPFIYCCFSSPPCCERVGFKSSKWGILGSLWDSGSTFLNFVSGKGKTPPLNESQIDIELTEIDDTPKLKHTHVCTYLYIHTLLLN